MSKKREEPDSQADFVGCESSAHTQLRSDNAQMKRSGSSVHGASDECSIGQEQTKGEHMGGNYSIYVADAWSEARRNLPPLLTVPIQDTRMVEETLTSKH